MPDQITEVAKIAVKLEAKYGVPAELCMAQWALESGWGKNCPGNNCFGLKAPKSASSDRIQDLKTSEILTDSQASVYAAEGRLISKWSIPGSNKFKCQVLDKFMKFKTLEEGLDYYAQLLSNGFYFKPRLEAYKKHKNLDKLLGDLAGKDGKPPYATALNYDQILKSIIVSNKIQVALAAAKQTDTMQAG